MIKFYRIFLVTLCVSTLTFNLFTLSAHAKEIDFDYSPEEGFRIKFEDLGTLKIGADIECGYLRDGALYASFGRESQVWQCSKVVLGIEGDSAEKNENSYIFFKLDIAPLYESIEVKNKEKIIYNQDNQGRDIDGNNTYVDWYKNQGSRLYYLGDVPLIEAYLGYKTKYHKLKFGRMKTIIGFSEERTFFQDDAKFAPMSYWLSKDLLTGLNYGFNYREYVEIDAAIYSGGNPAKGYTNYLDHVETPNHKSNNTPSYSGSINLNYSYKYFSGHIFASYMSHITGSVWHNKLKDGKRNSQIQAYGGGLDFTFDNTYVNSLRFFGQYTIFMSGLRESSTQNNKTAKFKDITQDGFFIASELTVFNNKGRIGASFERMDRFDYNIYETYNFSDSNPFRNSKQSSLILLANYQLTSFSFLEVAYHNIWNPALHVSDILDTRNDYRVKVSLQVRL